MVSELAHPKEISARETLDLRMFLGDEAGQFIHHAFAPGGGGEFGADVFAHAPVKPDQLRVDRLKRARPGGLDQADDFRKRHRLALGGRRWAPDGLGLSGFGGGFHFKLKRADFLDRMNRIFRIQFATPVLMPNAKQRIPANPRSHCATEK